MGIHYTYGANKGSKLMEKKAKRERKLAEKRAKKQAKSGFDKIIKNNLELPSIKEILFSSEIYIPITSFIFLLILGIILKNIFYKG